MYPASTTKIMTAILTIENCVLNDNVTASYDAVTSIPDGYSTVATWIQTSPLPVPHLPLLSFTLYFILIFVALPPLPLLFTAEEFPVFELTSLLVSGLTDTES